MILPVIYLIIVCSAGIYTEAEFMNVQFRFEVSEHNLKSSQTWGSEYNVYFTDQLQTIFARGEGGSGKNPFVEVTMNSKEENSLKTFFQITSKNSVSVLFLFLRRYIRWCASPEHHDNAGGTAR
jgi:hypothetical protein